MSVTAVSINDYLKQLHKNHRKHNRFTTFLMMLSLVVVLGVAWELRGIGISMTNETDCGIEEHQHSPGCYEIIQICGLDEGDETEDGMFHSHNDDCMEYRLLCDLEEHVHTVECIQLESTEPDAEEQTADDELKQPADEEQELLLTDETPEEETDETTEDEETLFYRELLEELRAGILELFAEVPEELEYVFADDFVLDEETYYEIIMSDALSDKTSGYDGITSYAMEGDGSVPEVVNPILNDFYVVTGIDARHKDKIHEYLENFGKGNPDAEKEYYYNDEVGPYVLHVGDTVVLWIYTDNDGWAYGEGPSTGGAETGYVYSNQYFSWRNEAETLSNGLRKVKVTITALNESITASDPVYVKYDNKKFYLQIKNGVAEYTKHYDHADIEVTDGGYYKVTDEVTLPDGARQLIVTTYDSLVKDVHECLIYNKSGEQINRYVSKDYQKKDDTATQYELTSKYLTNESKHFNQSEVGKVKFDVELELTPIGRSEIYLALGKEYAGQQGTSMSIGGLGKIIVEHAEFSLGQRSIIDANNKCPDWSGLDFNVISEIKGYKTVGLGLADLKASKILLNDITGQRIDLQGDDYQFELLDEDGKVIQTVNNTAGGSIDFERLYYASTGTFHYKIREVIPTDAIKIGENLYSYEQKIYDGRIVDVTVNVTLPLDGSEFPDTFHVDVSYSTGIEPEFTNRIPIAEKVKQLVVKKEWSNPSEEHPEITFKVYCRYGEHEPYAIQRNGRNSFTLSELNSWHTEFRDLPYELDGQECEYEVVELPMLGYAPQYITNEDGDVKTTTIFNQKRADVEINVKKEWVHSDGSLMTEPPDTDVQLTLTRKYQKIPLPVKITIHVPDYNGDREFVFDEYAYEGSKLVIQPTSNGQKLTGLSAQTINCEWSGNGDGTYAITNIQQDAEILMEDEGWVWHRTSADFVSGTDEHQWTYTEDATVDHCYTTRYTANTGASAIRVINRNRASAGAMFRLPADLNAGQTYSFSAYTMTENRYNKTDTPEVSGSSVTVKMTLVYQTVGTGTTSYRQMATCTFSGNDFGQKKWKQLSNENYQLPADLDNTKPFYLKFETQDDGANGLKRPDFYIDDVMFGPGGRKMQVDGTTGEYYHYDVATLEKGIPIEVSKWTEDEGWHKDITLNRSNGWTYKWNSSELEELGTRIYQYYVVESSGSERYKVSYISNGVSTNRESTPIIVRNRLAAYELPHTGGLGATHIRFLGLITLLCTGTAGVYIKKRRRRSSA